MRERKVGTSAERERVGSSTRVGMEGRVVIDPLSKSSKPAHTTSPVLGWFGHVTMTMNSRHGKHELISRMSQDKPWMNC